MANDQSRFFVCVPEGYFELSEDERMAAAMEMAWDAIVQMGLDAEVGTLENDSSTVNGEGSATAPFAQLTVGLASHIRLGGCQQLRVLIR
jgi:hypothetical protein